MLANIFRPASGLRAVPRVALAALARAAPASLHTRNIAHDANGASGKGTMADIVNALGDAADAMGGPQAGADGASGATSFQLASKELTREQHIKAMAQNVGSLVAPHEWSHKYATRPPPRRPRAGKLSPTAPDARYSDMFRQLGLNPVRECKNASLLSHYVTDMGKIRPRSQTGLSWRSQRLVGRAVRRSKMMGVLPVLSKGRTSADRGSRRFNGNSNYYK